MRSSYVEEEPMPSLYAQDAVRFLLRGEQKQCFSDVCGRLATLGDGGPSPLCRVGQTLESVVNLPYARH
jgi:hypothetical protein